MEKTDLFLGYRYIKASVEISVSSESETLLSIDVCRMLQMSSGQRPWQLHVIPFDLVTVSEKKGVISVSLMNETIEASCNFTLNKKGTLEAEISWKNNLTGKLVRYRIGPCASHTGITAHHHSYSF